MIQTMEHPKLVVNPFVIYIVFGLLAALLQFLLPLPFLSRVAAWIIGASILGLNFLFGLPALRVMFRNKTSPNPNKSVNALVQSGPYRISRNPMYIGLTMAYTGLVTILHLPWGLVFLPLVIWLITLCVIRPEEQYLEQKFGTDYLKYKQSVRRWI